MVFIRLSKKTMRVMSMHSTDKKFKLPKSFDAKEYFNPFDDATGILSKTNKTFSIHWYGKSWMDKKSVLRNKVSRIIHRMGLGNI